MNITDMNTEVEPVIEDVKFSNKCPKLPSLENLYITQRTDKYEMFMDNLLVAQLQKKHAKVLHKAKKREKGKKSSIVGLATRPDVPEQENDNNHSENGTTE